MADRQCPRDRALLHHATIGEVTLDVCGKCQGTFFDSGEMLGAFGQAADPAAWDRAETGGTVKPSELPCPRCSVRMHAQDVAHDGKTVEIDRCGKCRGVWLDKDEIDTIIAVGHAMQPLLEAERAKAKEEVAKLGDVSFERKPNTKLIVAVVLAVSALAGGLYWLTRPPPPAPPSYESGTRAKGEEGCPCGCDRSTAMAAALREKGLAEAARDIEKTLATISARENAGYITERMIQHRLRMRALASDLHVQLHDRQPRPARVRATDQLATASGNGLRVSAELVVHGERIEIVEGKEKLITPSFRLWLRIENLEDRERVLAVPTIRAAGIHTPVSRWYEEGTDGESWSGALPSRSVVRVLVIGDIPEHIRSGAAIEANVTLDGLTFESKAKALGTIVFPESEQR